MSQTDLEKLLGFLHIEYGIPKVLPFPAALRLPEAHATSAQEAPTDALPILPSATPQLVDGLREQLRQDPDSVIEAAPAVLGPEPTTEGLEWLFSNAKVALERSTDTLMALSANRGETPGFELPPEFQFPGYDSSEISIDPNRRKFEEVADAPAWAITAVCAVAFRLANPKPPFPRHSGPNGFTYPLRTSNGRATIALFSDWGTGYYHARYIAKHIGRLGAGQAVHLGDVYYTGTHKEFREHFEDILERYVVKQMPFFAMNANHEMDSNGVAYFEYLQRKRELGGKDGRAEQPQEGSYFCLQNDAYQVIGIDTAYWKNGRVQDAGLRDWLEERLLAGRNAGKVNILLSQNEPYENKETELLQDLRYVLERPGEGSLVDLWFWGDQHYCALYPPTARTPFIGSCIGHSGYPYYTRTKSWFSRHAVKPAWAETEPRFPRAMNRRQDVGNNGFVLLEAEPSMLRLRYIDWRAQERCVVDLPVRDGRLDWAGKVSPACDAYSA